MKYELIHDTIAKQIFEKASTEARTRRKVERYVRERYQAYLERGAKLTQDDVDFVTPYLEVVNISVEEAAFIKNGRLELQRAERRRRAIILGTIAILTTISLLAIWQWRSANTAREEALVQKNEAVAARQDADAKADSLIQKETLLQRSLRLAEERREEADSARILADANATLARQQTSRAESAALRARSIAIAARGRELLNTDPTVALNFAMYARELMPTQSAVNLVSDLMENPTLAFYGDSVGVCYLPRSGREVLILPERSQILYLINDQLELMNQVCEQIWSLNLSAEENTDLYGVYRFNLFKRARLLQLPEEKGFLVTTYSNEVLWISIDGQVIMKFEGISGLVTAMAIDDGDPFGAQIVLGTRGGGMAFFDLEGRLLRTFQLSDLAPEMTGLNDLNDVVDIAINPRRREMAILLSSAKILIYDIRTHEITATWQYEALSESFEPIAVDYAPELNHLLVGGRLTQFSGANRNVSDRTIILHRNGDRLNRTDVDFEGVSPQYFSRRRYFVTQGSTDLFVYEWPTNLSSPKLLRTIHQGTKVNYFAVHQETEAIICHRGRGPMGPRSYDLLTGLVVWVKPLWLSGKVTYRDVPEGAETYLTTFLGKNQEVCVIDQGKRRIACPSTDRTWIAPINELIVDVVYNPRSGDLTVVTTTKPDSAQVKLSKTLSFYELSADLTSARQSATRTYRDAPLRVNLVPDERRMFAYWLGGDNQHVVLTDWAGRSLGMDFRAFKVDVSYDGKLLLVQQNSEIKLINWRGEALQRFGLSEKHFGYDITGHQSAGGFSGNFQLTDSPYFHSVVTEYFYPSHYIEYERLLADYFWEHSGVYKMTEQEIKKYASDLF